MDRCVAKPWIADLILKTALSKDYDKEIKKTFYVFVRNVKRTDTIDGVVVIGEVTDDYVTVKSMFSEKCLQLFLKGNGNKELFFSMKNSIIILKKFKILPMLNEDLNKCNFTLLINELTMWKMHQERARKVGIPSVMESPRIHNKMLSLWREHQENSEDNLTSSHGELSQLIAYGKILENNDKKNQSYITSEEDSMYRYDGSLSPFTLRYGPPELGPDGIDYGECDIPIDQQRILDNIEEWKDDYVPPPAASISSGQSMEVTGQSLFNHDAKNGEDSCYDEQLESFAHLPTQSDQPPCNFDLPQTDRSVMEPPPDMEPSPVLMDISDNDLFISQSSPLAASTQLTQRSVHTRTRSESQNTISPSPETAKSSATRLKTLGLQGSSASPNHCKVPSRTPKKKPGGQSTESSQSVTFQFAATKSPEKLITIDLTECNIVGDSPSNVGNRHQQKRLDDPDVVITHVEDSQKSSESVSDESQSILNHHMISTKTFKQRTMLNTDSIAKQKTNKLQHASPSHASESCPNQAKKKKVPTATLR